MNLSMNSARIRVKFDTNFHKITIFVTSSHSVTLFVTLINI